MFIKEMYPWVGLVWPVARATSSFWAFTWTGIACSGASGNGSNGAYSATDDKTVMERSVWNRTVNGTARRKTGSSRVANLAATNT
ncbi:MAG TPA: hypothetical protein VL863_14680 [bacterium]|jgi:hypothetical protein|nr:hypothetical protein [bacterium]